MSGALTHIDVDSDEYEDTPRALREYVKKLQKQNETLTTELDGVKKTAASQAVSTVLADQGFKNPKRVENDLLADKVDPHDVAALNAWLAQNGDDYAKAEAAPAADPVAEGEPNPDAAALQKLTVNGQPASGLSPYDAAMAEITPDMDGDAVRKVFIKHGA